METYLTQEQQGKIIELFRHDHTVNEIADATNVSPRDVLIFLTGKGYWSKYCSECSIRRCYDCQGLMELGQPVSAQDTIDFIAAIKKAKDDESRPKA